MRDFDREAGGAFFRLDPAKKTNPKQPDFEGYLTIDDSLLQLLITLQRQGQPLKLRLAGWTKKAQSGNTFISLKPSEDKKAQQAQGRQPQTQQRSSDPWGDDSPF